MITLRIGFLDKHLAYKSGIHGIMVKIVFRRSGNYWGNDRFDVHWIQNIFSLHRAYKLLYRV